MNIINYYRKWTLNEPVANSFQVSTILILFAYILGFEILSLLLKNVFIVLLA